MRRIRFTVRRMMVAVAVLAVLMGTVVATRKWFDELVPPRDPVDWAKRQAAFYAAQRGGPDGFGRDDGASLTAQQKRYQRLAESFRRADSKWDESTLRGPFTNKLPTGQSVIAQFEAPDVDLGSVPAGTSCMVLSDMAGDDDDCSDSRLIEVRILDGAHAGRIAKVERIYLRRGP